MTVVRSTAEASAGPVTDDLLLHALQRWRPADDDTVAPRFTGRPIRILDENGAGRQDLAHRSDRFLLDVLDGAEDEELRPEIVSRSRDAVLRRLGALRDRSAEPTGVYTFLDTTIAGVREYILLLPDDALSVTVYETTDGIEDIEIGPFDETGEP